MEWQHQLALFAASVLFFHVSEFLLAAVFMRQQLGWHSWLVSKPYCIAMLTGLVEFSLETWLLPQLKAQAWVTCVGVAVVVGGEAIRKAGMLTAGKHFQHSIQTQKDPEHQLVTWGIYAYVRHPGYLGWILWSTGTQLLLLNPICSVAFAVVAWRFFKVRVPYEEALLIQFFGLDYIRYRARTPTFIPQIP